MHVPLSELTQERYEAEGWRGRPLFVVCPEALESCNCASEPDDLDISPQHANKGGSGPLADGVEPSGDREGSKAVGFAGAQPPADGGSVRGPWAEGLQACIRLRKVLGHEEVFLVR